jgi:hypothetical protein
MTSVQLAVTSRAVVNGSVLISAVSNSVQWLTDRAAALWRDMGANESLRPSDTDRSARELRALENLFATSRIVGAIWWPVRQIVRSCRTARIQQTVATVRETMAPLNDTQLCQLAGVALGIAALVNGLLRQFDPRPAAPIRTWLWAAVLAVAVLLIVAAPKLVIAWRSRISIR